MNIKAYTISSLSFIVSLLCKFGAPDHPPFYFIWTLLLSNPQLKKQTNVFLKLKHPRYKAKRLLIYEASARAAKQIL